MNISPTFTVSTPVCPVSTHNEWDPLEEVIVGRLEGATIPSNHAAVTCNIPGAAARGAHGVVAGLRYPRIMVEPAQRELDGFIELLTSMGITVRRPRRSTTASASARRTGRRVASSTPARATACSRSATRSSRRRWPGARAISRPSPTASC
jgi:hypothetical protein